MPPQIDNSWKDMDEDDRMGYLEDYIVTWAKQHKIKDIEDLMKEEMSGCIVEFVVNCLQATGELE